MKFLKIKRRCCGTPGSGKGLAWLHYAEILLRLLPGRQQAFGRTGAC